MKTKTLIGMVAVLLATGILANAKPIQLSLTPEIALYDRTEKIEGLTLSIWGENPQAGLALGFVNGSTGQSAGLSLGLLINYADSYKGVQATFICNYTKADFLGWQIGSVNYTDGIMKGLQTGFVNYAGKLTGLQIGLVNYAASAETGVQIGFVNLMPQNAWFTGLPDELAPGMVIVNWCF
jgi:hypothetical protein